MKEEQSHEIAKKAVKISITCIFITIIISLINIYILLNQVSATAAISKEVKSIESKLNIQRAQILNPE